MIDEKRLIEDIDNCVVGLTNIQMMQIADIIETQPKVNEWIPCSERLPDESVEGLEWTVDEDGKHIACDVLVTFVSKSENNKRYVTDAIYFPGLSLSECFTVDDVVAWKTPEPYKEE